MNRHSGTMYFDPHMSQWMNVSAGLGHEGWDRRQKMSLLRTNGEWPKEIKRNNELASRCQNMNGDPAYQTLAQVPKTIRSPRHAQCQMVSVDYR